jgi:bifunctional non-homologous end joining protein LigD
VAMPLAWTELAALKRGDAYTLANVPALLKKRRRDPWAGFAEIEQDLSDLDFGN